MQIVGVIVRTRNGERGLRHRHCVGPTDVVEADSLTPSNPSIGSREKIEELPECTAFG